jgi:hypothetical protein
MWNGNHLGSSIISTGIYGTPRHGSSPNNASAGFFHMRRLRVVAGEFQCVVRLDGAAQVQLAVVIQRPAAVLGLARTQVIGDLQLQRRVDLVEEVHHHDVLRRNRTIRFEFVEPIPLAALLRDQCIARRGDGAVQRRGVGDPLQRVRDDIAARVRQLRGKRSGFRGGSIHDPELP